jgi:outer membrane receptor protein involved in Fe transport
MNQQTLRAAVRSALAAGLIASAGLPAAAFAQTGENPANLGKVEVTGTRIKRTDIETAQPVTQISHQQIENTGLTSIGEILQQISSSGSTLNLLASYGGNSNFTGGGTTQVDLRYLGSKRTLVLVNGHRWVTGLDGTVDLNSIPLSIIDRIEVLQDGASAIYGSDAVAGVVNIITRKQFDGAKASAYVGEYTDGTHWDGRAQKYDVTLGAEGDHKGIYGDISYTKQGAIFTGDRDYSKYPKPFPTAAARIARGTAGTPQGRFQFIPPKSSPLAHNSALCPEASFGTFSAPYCDVTPKKGTNGQSIADFKPFTRADRYNYAQDHIEQLLTPEQRLSGFLRAHYDFTPDVSFISEFLYNNRRSKQLIAAAPYGFAPNGIPVYIPTNQQYNPFGFPLSTSQPVDLGYTYTSGPNAGQPVAIPNFQSANRRLTEATHRYYEEEVNTYLFHGGFQGDFMLGDRSFSWDAGYIYSRVAEEDTNSGLVYNRAVVNALGDPHECAQHADCVPLDLFGGQGVNGTGTITPDQLNYIEMTDQNRTTVDLRSAEANLSTSDLVDLPGGPLGLAVGYEYREQDGHFIPDSVEARGNDTDETIPETQGSFNVNSVYGELNIPIVSQVPGFYSLSADAAARYSDYSTFGSTTNERLGVKWEPIHDLLLRATWSSAYRAPDINDLYAGNTFSDEDVSDPCSNYAHSGVSAAVVATCKADGVPSSYFQENAQIGTRVGGNANLKPETSISRTAGIVYNPHFVPGLSINGDYYKIELSNAIQPIGAQSLIDGCYVAQNAGDCARIHRINFGHIDYIDDSTTNIGGILTEGFDYGLRYRLNAGGYGTFNFLLAGTHITAYEQYLPGQKGGRQVDDLLGRERSGTAFPLSVPQDKAHFGVTWNLGNWSANWTVYYISGLDENCSDELDGTKFSMLNTGVCSHPVDHDPKKSTNHLGAVTYHNVQVSYTFPGIHTTLTGGVRNLFNKEPPPDPKAFLDGFDTSQYMALIGMFPYARVSVSF